MRYIRLSKKFSNVLFIPTLLLMVCLVVFKDALSAFKYVQLLRYLLVFLGIILIIGALVKDKDEKNN